MTTSDRGWFLYCCIISMDFHIVIRVTLSPGEGSQNEDGGQSTFSPTPKSRDKDAGSIAWSI